MTAPTERLRAALAGRYAVERELGAGGMATVYLAQDLKHDRKVAVKVLRPELAAALGPDRFPREIRILARLQHPHILPLLDSGEAGGFLFYTMPLVDGESLRQRIDRDGALPVPEATRILREVADALASAHAAGVLHRDIKPGNVMISGRHALVMDFGVAKAVSDSGGEKMTTVGVAVGTPTYMSPEQATGGENLDLRSDIYALGLLAYEMLTGKPPFDGKTAQAILSAQVLEKPAPIAEKRPAVSAGLGEFVMKCLEKSPDNRYQTTDELVPLLEALATPSGGITPTQTRPVKTVAAAAPARSGHRAMLIGAGVALVVLGAVFGAWKAMSGGTSGSDVISKIGVMPIEDISGKDSVFVAAMHDALTSALTRANLAGVETRSTMMRYKTGGKTIREVARELSLGGVVEATVFRAGDVMRINVQFTDPVTSRSLWSETYEKNVKDVLAAQSEVVGLVATGIGGVLGGTKKPGDGK